MKYSDHLSDWLVELGYNRCFFVAGGNIMHLIESLSRRMPCNAVIHEVAAGIAAEYYNETSSIGRAFALVTAGPGLTNIVTAIAGAFLESRELLVIGGQVKRSDLSHGIVRQRGIQEIDGVSIVKPISKVSTLLTNTISFEKFRDLKYASRNDRKGPVFIEIPLDIQACEYSETRCISPPLTLNGPRVTMNQLQRITALIRGAERPVFLLGGGLSRTAAKELLPTLTSGSIPVATTWNGADRIGANNPVYIGRPNTWGQRSANLILQQTDLLIAVGTRLGLQQTGFNWEEFIPVGEIVQVEIDSAELSKTHPRVAYPICADAADFLSNLLQQDLGNHTEWLNYAQEIRECIPLIEPVNTTGKAYVSPYVFIERLASYCKDDDVIIPCSSGGAFTVMMQTFSQKEGQLLVTNKGLAAMGYGLSGAIGAAFANPDRRVILTEGDGGFAQNLQEIGTAKINKLNLKIFVFDDSGYASIRMTQRSYFNGRYIGCDTDTGLGLPEWEQLFNAWDVPVHRIGPEFDSDNKFQALFDCIGIVAFIVPIDPEQTYFPRITSQITSTGAMISNPLHIMTPQLSEVIQSKVGRYLP